MSEEASYDRHDQEPPKAFAAFVLYRNLGPQRSLKKAIEAENPELLKDDQKFHSRMVRFKTWSKCWRWVERCAAWDAENERLDRIRWQEERKAAVKRQAKLALAIQGKATAGLDKLKAETLTARDLLAFVQTGVGLERQALGLNDEKPAEGEQPPGGEDATASLAELIERALRAAAARAAESGAAAPALPQPAAPASPAEADVGPSDDQSAGPAPDAG